VVARGPQLSGGDHTGFDLDSKRWNPRRAGLVAQQAGHAFGQEPLLPSPDRSLARTGAAGDFHRAAAIGCQRDDLCPPDMLLRVLLQRLALIVVGLRAELTRLYAAMSNNVAMNVAWALMSLPPMFRTCPFLIMAIAS
jgi:hypothetical protein